MTNDDMNKAIAAHIKEDWERFERESKLTEEELADLAYLEELNNRPKDELSWPEWLAKHNKTVWDESNGPE